MISILVEAAVVAARTVKFVDKPRSVGQVRYDWIVPLGCLLTLYRLAMGSGGRACF